MRSRNPSWRSRRHSPCIEPTSAPMACPTRMWKSSTRRWSAPSRGGKSRLTEPMDFIGRLLKLDFEDGRDLTGALNFARRFQQTTGAVMAKAVEDTVFYRYNRLIALNEVGGEPDQYGAPVGAFHEAMRMRLEDQPQGLAGDLHPRYQAGRGRTCAALHLERGAADVGADGRRRCRCPGTLSKRRSKMDWSRPIRRRNGGSTSRFWGFCRPISTPLTGRSARKSASG